jgi:hypothetical protein
MPHIGLVDDRDGFLEIQSRASAVFDLDRRLPQQVFRRDAGGALFCEFDAILTPEFWSAFSAMARWHGDRQVDLLVVAPGADAFYLPEYQTHPAMTLPVDADSDDYWAAIGFDSGSGALGSIAISANVVAVTGPSGNWGCWAERDPEVAVFRGFPDATVRRDWGAKFGPCHDASGALETYLPWTFAKRTVPGEYAAALIANYGSG